MSECNNPACDCKLSLIELATKRRFCLCFDSVIPRGRYARPSLNCPLHKTLAQRWDSIKTQAEFDAALAADSQL